MLSDDELISAALYRTDLALDALLGKKKKGTPSDWAEQLTGAKKTAYIISYFESDVQTDGLEYFLKRSQGFAPLVSKCLETVGAAEHQTLYDEWCAAHGTALSYGEFLEYQDEITAFNKAYTALPPMERYLAPYLRAHIEEF
jgi:hypothetical protein